MFRHTTEKQAPTTPKTITASNTITLELICNLTAPDGKPYCAMYWCINKDRQDKRTGPQGVRKPLSYRARTMYREVMKKWL